MELPRCPLLEFILDSSLEGWDVIGSGGFGQIYKARHSGWCCDVAVKLLHHDNGNSSSLLREIDMMRQGSSPFVLQVLGVFRGRLPSAGPSIHLGLVMEFMERGSVASLQEVLGGAPPWPLLGRLAHQVALGINFLHQRSPPLLHLDLKPSNVLLDSDLNAKLTDFGLSKFSQSVSRASKEKSSEEGGTLSYMPPEAFVVGLYKPTRASDIYSYGILLWSIITGKIPYENAISSMVRLRIPHGDRPSLEEISGLSPEPEGLTALVELMKECWDADPTRRPTSNQCVKVTEAVYKIHKDAIHAAVVEVVNKMDRLIQDVGDSWTPAYHGANIDVGTTCLPVQEVADGLMAEQRGEPQLKDATSAWSTSLCPSDATSAWSASVCHEAAAAVAAADPSAADHRNRASSVCPLRSSPPTPQTHQALPAHRAPPTHQAPPNPPLKPSPQGKAAYPPQMFHGPNLAALFQRQLSSPTPERGVCITLSNVSGLQIGNGNVMRISGCPDLLERRRHPSAPSSVNLPPPRPGSWK